MAVRAFALAPATVAALSVASPALADPAGRAAPTPALSVASLPGWADDDHAAALAAFLRTCRSPRPLCRAARRAAEGERTAARDLFETRFAAVPVAATGFLTGYFEPEVRGSLVETESYRVPLLARPPGLVPRPAHPPSGWPDGLAAARRVGRGYEAMPDRAAIEAGALGPDARPVLFLADPVDAFTVHVQGSARVRLPDGGLVRVGFDGKNGHPYRAIARVVAERTGLPPAELTAGKLWAWLRAHPAEAPDIMRANRSFIFFRRLDTPAEDGPVGAAGVPLSPGRSLAVDRSAWPYGTLVWLEGDLPGPDGGRVPLRRLVVAQDTGTAIVGQARGDLFVGSGDAAGQEAGLIRHAVRWVVLRPRPAPAARKGARAARAR